MDTLLSKHLRTTKEEARNETEEAREKKRVQRLAAERLMFETAIRTGDLKFAIRKARYMSEFYDNPTELEDRLAVADLMLKMKSTPDSFTDLFGVIQPVLDRAIKADRYEQVKAVLSILSNSGRRLMSKSLRKEIAELTQRVEAMEQKYKALEPKIENLPQGGKDSFQAVGEFYFFEKKDYQLGAELLSRGDSFLKEIADEFLTARKDRHLVLAQKIAASRFGKQYKDCLLYTSPSPRDLSTSRMPSSA